VVIVLGEAIINATFRAHTGEVGVHTEYGRASLGISCAFFIAWLYFSAESSRRYTHALRRHWVSAILFGQLHFPLTSALILVGASMAALVAEQQVVQGLRWYFSGGVAIAVLCTALIGATHRSMDDANSSLVPRGFRLTARAMAAAVIACIPLGHHLDTTDFLGVHVGVLAFAAFLDTFGKLGSTARDSSPTAATHDDPNGAEGDPDSVPTSREVCLPALTLGGLILLW
jgi:low temperature requirement protein LtrA